MYAEEIQDLRSAIGFLEKMPGSIMKVKKEVDSYVELAGIYKKIEVSSSCTGKVCPAVIFENIKGYSVPIISGLFASRERVASLLGTTIDKVAYRLLDAVDIRIST